MSHIDVATAADAERLARQAHAGAVGTIIRVGYVMGYQDDGSHEFYAPAGETIAVRVMPTDDQSLTHWNDEFLDPYWDVELVDRPEFIPAGADNFWIDGPSFRLIATA